MPDLHAFGVWLMGILLYIPQKVFEYITDGLISGIDALFAACSVCDFSQLSSNMAALPLATLYVLGWFKVGTGLTVFVGMEVLRRELRLIKFVKKITPCSNRGAVANCLHV